MNRLVFSFLAVVFCLILGLLLLAFLRRPITQETTDDLYWKKVLTPAQYTIMRRKGTEAPFSGILLHNTEKGTYVSPGCEKPLFRSEDKYDSGTGWPSFTKPISDTAVQYQTDYELGYPRTEVLDLCGNHLGHVFDDGPAPTGKRYCMNSEALHFIPDKP